MRVSEMTSRDVRVTTPTENLLTAARKMAQFDVAALVVGENERLIGMVTTCTAVREFMSTNTLRRLRTAVDAARQPASWRRT